MNPEPTREWVKEQAGEWTPRARWYRATMAAIVWGGWSVWRPDETTPLASGPETGARGQCLADLVLCAHGFLAWERIAFPDGLLESAALNALDHESGSSHPLTPTTLPAVLAAVREVSR